MRFVTLILLSLIMYLAVIPCNDTAEAESNKTSYNTPGQSVQDHGEQSHNNNDCSPFCVCNCSQTRSFVPYSSFKGTLALNINRNSINPFPDFYPDGIIHSIWRPPQSA